MRSTLLFGLLMAALMAVAAPAIAAPPTDTTMAYCDVGDLTDLYGAEAVAQLTGDASGAIVDETKVNTAIDAASSDIEIAVVTQYGESLVERDLASLRNLAIDGAFYRLQITSQTEGGEKDDAPRLNLARWDLKLDRIADGTRKLLTDAQLAGDADGDGQADERPSFQSSPRLFGRAGNPALNRARA